MSCLDPSADCNGGITGSTPNPAGTGDSPSIGGWFGDLNDILSTGLGGINSILKTVNTPQTRVQTYPYQTATGVNPSALGGVFNGGFLTLAIFGLLAFLAFRKK